MSSYRKYWISLVFFTLLYNGLLIAQTDSLSAAYQLGGDGYREGQYPGLGRAASEIFYSEKKVTLSGYAELANVFNGGKTRDTSSGDLELYFNQLYRIVPFIGIRLSKNWFLTTELGIEYLEGNGENEFHFFPEIYTDIIYRSWLSFRIGLQPLNIGYINNNEEPLLFLSVNRPETERLILPTEWIETGITFYGDVSNKLNYALSFTNGLIARKFTSPTWIRNGAESHFESFNRLAINAQINYLPINNLTLSISGYYNHSGRGEEVFIEGNIKKVEAPLTVISGYARWDHKAFSIIGMGSWGNLSQTYDVWFLTGYEQSDGQVLGENVYGFYIEPSLDLFRLFKVNTTGNPKPGSIFTIHDSSFPVFIRYERLDTHSAIDARLSDLYYLRNNLNIWMVGFNYKPNHNIALKFDVRFRDNLNAVPEVPDSETLYELGIGIEF